MLSSKAAANHRTVVILAGLNGLCLVAYTILSYGLTPRVPFGHETYKNAFFTRRAEMLAFLGQGVQDFVTGQSSLARPEVFLLAYGLPLLISTAVFLALLTWLARHKQELHPDTPQFLFRSAALFAGVCVLASPVLVMDFWYPIGWGRMIMAGLNPYHVTLPLEFTRDLPLGNIPRDATERMMYGPLWAVGYGVLMWLAQGNVVVGSLLLKLVHAGAWIGSLWLIWSLLRASSVWRQCVGIVIFGWLPLSLMQAVAEGHNDIFMVFFILLWLYGLERQKGARATFALAASFLIKYASAPFFVLDFLHSRYSQRRPLRAYLLVFLGAVALIALIGGLFYRSPEFFMPLNNTRSWHFYSLREAVMGLDMASGLLLPYSRILRALFPVAAIYFLVRYVQQPRPEILRIALVALFFSLRDVVAILQKLNSLVPSFSEMVRVIFPAVAIYFVVRYVQRPDSDTFRTAVLGVMCAVLFGLALHIWPWYLVWVIGLAAIVPEAALARWSVGAALVFPFPILIWIVLPDLDPSFVFDYPTLAMYILAALWFAFAPQGWFSEVEPRGEQRPIIPSSPAWEGEY